MILLDTHVISELMRPTPDEVVTSWLDEQFSNQLFIPSIVKTEIEMGIAILDNGKRKQALLQAAELIFTSFSNQCLGIEFDNVSFNPITLKDRDEIEHTFIFQTRLIGYQVIIEAKEQRNDDSEGYQLSVLGDVDDDLFDLFKVLFERMRRALSQKHIEASDLTKYRITDQDIVRGYITSGSEGSVGGAMVVIDGKEIEWYEFGRMLSTYEGFNFKLEIFDKTEEK